jgi:general L-amino acid transport system substrate-binding protein
MYQKNTATLLLALASLLFSQISAAATLDDVRKRNSLRCGVNGDMAGLSQKQSDGRWSGMDVDICRAAAAAVLGDAERVEYVPLDNQQRLDALAQDKIDLLARNTTWTLSRDTAHGMNFVATSYFDGQGLMVRRDKGHRSVLELDGASVCVQAHTTSLSNVQRFFTMNRMKIKIIPQASAAAQRQAYEAGECDALSSDQSQLYAIRNELKAPSAHEILPEIISKEPLGPAVRKGDGQWADIVRWTLFALIEAEEQGISSVNVEQAREQATNPVIQGFLGTRGDIGGAMGLDAQWAYRVISQVGNYGEVFERNLGSLGIKRGLNALWRDGGLLFAPPVR